MVELLLDDLKSIVSDMCTRVDRLNNKLDTMIALATMISESTENEEKNNFHIHPTHPPVTAASAPLHTNTAGGT